MTRELKKSLVHAGVVAAVMVVLAAAAPALDGAMTRTAQLLVYDSAINIVLALGLALILGITGQFSIGHAGFLAAGAYAALIVAGKPAFLGPQVAFWCGTLGLPVSMGLALVLLTATLAAVAVTCVLGIVVGLPALRLRGDYLAIATLGFGEIVAVLINNWSYVSGSTGMNLYGERSGWLGTAEGEAVLGGALARYFRDHPDQISAFWMGMGVLLALVVVRNIKYSTGGRALLAIREDPIASEAVGVPTTRLKVTAFVLGAALAGVAGGMLSHHQPANPADFRFLRSVEIILMVILGGQGSVTGAVVGAVVVTLLPQVLRTSVPRTWNIDIEQWRLVIYAIMIILAMLFRPQGLFGRFEITDVARWAYRKIRGVKTGTAAVVEGAASKPPGSGEIPPGVATLTREEPAWAGRSEKTAGKPATHDVPLLEADHATMQFGGLRAVDDLCLRLMPGELVGLIGPNGAGKTTAFNILTGVYRATRGDIRVCGKSVLGLRPSAISQRGVARTFQNIRLFGGLSVLDNVQIAQHAHHRQGIPSAILRTPGFFREERESRERALGYLAIFGLVDLAEERAGGLSYGDQRRLEIARALATRPKVLLLDEPAAGMNPTEKRELMDLIREVRSRFGLTILLIEHDMKVVMGVCERILVLDYGKSIAHGTPEQIRKDPAVIEAYLGASAKHG